MHNQNRARTIILITAMATFTLFALAGCRNGYVTPAPVLTALPTEEVPPTATSAPSSLVLVDPSGTASEDVMTALNDFAVANALTFQNLPALDTTTLTPEMKIVVFLAEPTNLNDLLNTAPQTQFIVSGSADPAGRTNLSVIRSDPVEQAFMAGYLATIIAWDWRSGGMIPNDTTLGTAYGDAFETGGNYLCGRCTSAYPPYLYSPTVLEDSVQAGTAAWQALTVTFSDDYINTIFVAPEVTQPELLDTLAGLRTTYQASDVQFVGFAGTTSPERFAALVGFDALPALQQLLPQVLAGTGGTVVKAVVKITAFADDTLITPGKVALFDTVAFDLAAGYIAPLSVP